MKKAAAALTLEKPLPENLDAERFIFGAVLANPQAFAYVAAILNARDFSLDRHRRIFERMAELNAAGVRIDRVTLIEALRVNGELEVVGGISYVVSLDEGMPQLANVESYCSIVLNKAILRRAITASEALMQRCLTGHEDLAELASDAQAIVKILNHESGTSKLRTATQLIAEAGGINQFFLQEHGSGISTPFAGINSTLSGMQEQQLIVLAARPSVGKSALAMQIAGHASLVLHKRTVVYSLEMSSASLLRRAVSARAGISGMKVRTGRMDASDYEKFSETVGEILDSDTHLYLQFSEQAHVTSLAIKADLQRMKAIGKQVEFLVIDYLQLMGSVGRYDNKVQEVSEISRGLKLIAKEFRIPVLALSQLSRAIETRGDSRPQLSDLRDSGSIEQDADAVLFLWPKKRVEEDDAVRVINWAVAKQREGPLNEGELLFHRKTVRFEDTTVVIDEAA